MSEMEKLLTPDERAEARAKQLHADFDAWFARLQALTSRVLVQEDWPERWFDGYTPEEALEDGPEEN